MRVLGVCDSQFWVIRAAALQCYRDSSLFRFRIDGHIAFNEPGSSLTSRTRVKTLVGRTYMFHC